MSETTASHAENKMGVLPVPKLLLDMALPLMISMLVQALYNIVDSIYVSRINEAALTAVSMAFPFQSVMISVMNGTCIGMNAMLSKCLGEKDFDGADSAANNTVLLSVCSYVAFVILGLLLARPFYNSQIGYDQEIVGYGITYMRICMIFSLGFCFQIVFERMMQGTGLTVMTMATQIIGAVTNIILDPVLIFGLGPFPKMGVAGAAAATCIGQTIAGIVGIILNQRFNKDIHVSVSRILHPNGQVIRRIYRVGVPSIIMSSVSSVMYYGLNTILAGFNSTASAVFGVYYKLQSFFFMPVFGLNGAIVPIIAYNLGARKRRRMTAALKVSMIYAVCIMSLGLLCFELIPNVLLGFFAASDNMLAIGDPALHIIGIHFPVAAICITLGSTFQALSKATYSAIISLGRQIVVLLPAAYLLAKFGGLSAVWWCFPIAEVMSLILTLIFFRKIYREIILNVPDNE